MSGRDHHGSTTSMSRSSTTDKSCAVPSSIQGDLKPEKAWRVTLEKEGQAPALRNECRVIPWDIEYPSGADAFPGNLSA